MNISCVHLKLSPLKLPFRIKFKERRREATYKVREYDVMKERNWKRISGIRMSVRYASYDLSKTKSHAAHFCVHPSANIRVILLWAFSGPKRDRSLVWRCCASKPTGERSLSYALQLVCVTQPNYVFTRRPALKRIWS